MYKIILYTIIVLLILYFSFFQTCKNFKNMEFFPINYVNSNPGWQSWWPWNQSTRFPRLYYDIRGDPNLVYRKYMLGPYIPYGYVFGPHLYNSQGKLIHDLTKPYYVA